MFQPSSPGHDKASNIQAYNYVVSEPVKLMGHEMLRLTS